MVHITLGGGFVGIVVLQPKGVFTQKMLLRSGTYYETTEIGFKFTIKTSATLLATILASLANKND